MANILLVEDDDELAVLLEKALAKEGHTVRIVSDGAAALDQLRVMRPDIMLLDIILPKLSGFDILERLQRDTSFAHPPVIVISNSGQPVEIERAKALGAQDYLIKAEIEPEEVVEKVKMNLQDTPAPSGGTAPVAPDSAAAAPDAAAAPSTTPGGKAVLVVEDDRFLRELIVQKLKREGLSVLEAITGDDALRIAKERTPGIILLDLILPGIDGFEVLRQLKEETKTAAIPVIVLSNLGQREDIDRGLRLGAVDFMIKAHFTPGEIVAKVKETMAGGGAAAR